MAKRAIESDNESEDNSRAKPQGSKRQRTEESDGSDVGSPEPAPKPSNRKAKAKAGIDDYMDVVEDVNVENEVTINEDDEKRIKELKAEYRQDVEDIVKENFAAFERKFNMGITQMKDELAAKIDRQGDRVISAVTDGPHKRIKDKVTSIRPFKIKRS